ncbi:PhzF family phenazine biosynthesis protein [Sneathiella limimaris]|uniref:PhzF family phenazine biosynthesis protein n=1 Tax=Sneathiella limimaris TaxID=1964213 RepID=UPI00146B2648|nr:PhzF family phenazine biosynthesis protein [Sneathiella limimaris]
MSDVNTAKTEGRIIPVQIVNAFVKDGTGGNPAGVVLDADNLSADDKLAIAAKVGLSETAFVSTSETETIKLDFFTPNRQIAHCGHATIATFSYLASLGRVAEGDASKETVDGPRQIKLQDGAAYMEQLAPRYDTAESWPAKDVSDETILSSLGLTANDLIEGSRPTLVNTGNNFILVGVKTPEILQNLTADQGAIEAISNKLDLIGYYVFTLEGTEEGVTATSRMFAPAYGIEEEAATGMAAGPLACLLHDQFGYKTDTLILEQGRFMSPASPSEITVNLSLENGQITGLMAGGYGKVMQILEVEI